MFIGLLNNEMPGKSKTARAARRRARSTVGLDAMRHGDSK
jgi:hypothetical protein